VIGIAVIVVSVVGTTILLIVFFDQWWSFLCDVCGRRKTQRKNGKEELVPDWERGSWELRMEGNLPAYPSFGSPPPRQKEQVQQVTPQAQSPKVDMHHPSILSVCSIVPVEPTYRIRRMDHPE